MCTVCGVDVSSSLWLVAMLLIPFGPMYGVNQNMNNAVNFQIVDLFVDTRWLIQRQDVLRRVGRCTRRWDVEGVRITNDIGPFPGDDHH